MKDVRTLLASVTPLKDYPVWLMHTALKIARKFKFF